jgi:hypothetical protein
MTKLLSILILNSTLVVSSAFSSDLILNERKHAESPTKIFIPVDLKEAVSELKAALAPGFKKELKSRPLFMLHSFEGYELKDWMIKAWALDNNSRLAQYFKAKGITKARSMASAVLSRWEESEQGLDISEKEFFEEQVELEASLESYLKLPPKPDGSSPDPPPFPE